MLGVFIKCLLFSRNAGCILAKIRALRKGTQRDGQGFVGAVPERNLHAPGLGAARERNL